MPYHLRLGLERCLEQPPALLRKRRLGLLMNQASVDRQFRFAHHLIADRFPGQLKALYAPQHGFWSERQDNMVESPHEVDEDSGIPVYSLYSDTRRPGNNMLADIDMLLVDLQDVGTRVYTFIWTLAYCLQDCAQAGIPVVVLDRPNPIGAQRVEGPQLDPACASFVGLAPIPMRHGLTIGELACVVNRMLGYGADLHVIPLDGYRRTTTWRELPLSWTAPSPNLPRLEGVFVYPGQVLLEGTTLSEGRGTTLPFELCGSPQLDTRAILAELRPRELHGITFRRVRFEPTFQKHVGQRCHGIQLHVTDESSFRPYRTTVCLLDAITRVHSDQTLWRDPPYEYETQRMPIDILSGHAVLRTRLDQRHALSDTELRSLTQADLESWRQRVAPHMIYEGVESLRA